MSYVENTSGIAYPQQQLAWPCPENTQQPLYVDDMLVNIRRDTVVNGCKSYEQESAKIVRHLKTLTYRHLAEYANGIRKWQDECNHHTPDLHMYTNPITMQLPAGSYTYRIIRSESTAVFTYLVEYSDGSRSWVHESQVSPGCSNTGPR